MTTRRAFVQCAAQAAALTIGAPLVAQAAPALVGLAPKGRVIGGGFVDDDAAAGHALRDGVTVPTGPRTERAVSVAIVGGGIGGLSAAWRLDARGLTDWTLLELGTQLGGNARSAEYPGLDGLRAPWGAHYLPVPDASAVHVRELCRELGLLSPTGEWDETMLCHAPQERLWQHGRWREGLDPLDAATAAERRQFAQFESLVAEWRASGMFSVPSAQGHAVREEARRQGGAAGRRAAEVDALDRFTADQWLRSLRLDAPALRWWVEYGTRDDYGASLQQASAWAAMHYFAARGDEEQGPLTWPEGNDYLVRALTRRLARRGDARGRARLQSSSPVLHLTRRGTGWLLDTPRERIIAEAVVWAAPLFVLPRVLRSAVLPVRIEYAPWMVANLVLDRPPAERGAPMAWDNVIYGSSALGYVNAQHQQLGTPQTTQLWTWYHALTDRPALAARQQLRDTPWSAWRDHIIADLQRAHPDIAQRLVRIDIRRWGHAMARPVPGALARVKALREWEPGPRLFMAHADLSNLSLFEEAQWHGVAAADRVVRALQ